MNKINRFLSIVSLLVVFGAGLLFGLSLDIKKMSPAESSPAAVSERAEGVSVLVDTGQRILVFKDLAGENLTALSALNQIGEKNSDFTIASKDYGDLGVLVTSLAGVANGADNKYWQFWVNNEYSQVAADKYALKDGDVVMWKFTNSQIE